MRRSRFAHEFVEFVPSQLEEGKLYVSVEYATAVHLCACGCGNKVVTPLSPAEWQLIYDGESISLHPSVGNWQFPCQSHYWVHRSQVRWAAQWSPRKIEAGRERDAADLARYHASRSEKVQADEHGTKPARGSVFARARRLLRISP